MGNKNIITVIYPKDNTNDEKKAYSLRKRNSIPETYKQKFLESENLTTMRYEIIFDLANQNNLENLKAEQNE